MKALKKTLSLVLAVCLVASMACVAAVSVSANAGDPVHSRLVTDVVNSEADNQVDTDTFYFYCPDDWKNEYNDYYNYNPETKTFDGAGGYFAAGIYWWDGPYNANDYKGDLEQGWPGFAVTETDPGCANVYVAKVPHTAGKIIWNSLVDGGMDASKPYYSKSPQTQDIDHEYYDPGEDKYGFYPDGISEEEGFSGKIFVMNPNDYEENPLTHRFTFKGEWFYYFGNGEYSYYKTRDDAVANNALYKNGEFPPYGFQIDTPELSVKVGKVSDPIKPNDASATVKIEDESIVKVDSVGADGSIKLKGLKAGKTVVKFTAQDKQGLTTRECKVTVSKNANPITVKATNKTYKASKLNKKAQSYKAIKVSKAQGKVTYKVTKKNSKIKFSKGKVTVKKKTKKGTYKIKVKVTAAGNASYNSKSVTKTITVKVKK